MAPVQESVVDSQVSNNMHLTRGRLVTRWLVICEPSARTWLKGWWTENAMDDWCSIYIYYTTIECVGNRIYETEPLPKARLEHKVMTPPRRSGPCVLTSRLEARTCPSLFVIYIYIFLWLRFDSYKKQCRSTKLKILYRLLVATLMSETSPKSWADRVHSSCSTTAATTNKCND